MCLAALTIVMRKDKQVWVVVQPLRRNKVFDGTKRGCFWCLFCCRCCCFCRWCWLFLWCRYSSISNRHDARTAARPQGVAGCKPPTSSARSLTLRGRCPSLGWTRSTHQSTLCLLQCRSPLALYVLPTPPPPPPPPPPSRLQHSANNNNGTHSSCCRPNVGTLVIGSYDTRHKLEGKLTPSRLFRVCAVGSWLPIAAGRCSSGCSV